MIQKPEIGKILQCDECKEEKNIRSAIFHEKRGWIRFCLECFHRSAFGKYLEDSREIALKPEEFCEKHNRPKKLWKKGENGKLEAHCFVCNRETWINSLEHLHSDPLKIAKFFYEKGADTWPTIQRLVYFSYVQSIKQNKILFEEKFEVWEGNNPILISLYQKSTNGIYPLSPTTVLKDIEEPTNSFIRNILADIYKNFDYYEEEKKRLDLAWNELLELSKEEELDLAKIYPWQFKESQKYILSYAS